MHSEVLSVPVIQNIKVTVKVHYWVPKFRRNVLSPSSGRHLNFQMISDSRLGFRFMIEFFELLNKNSWLHFTNHCHVLRFSLAVLTGRCFVAAFNGGRFPSSRHGPLRKQYSLLWGYCCIRDYWGGHKIAIMPLPSNGRVCRAIT
jgi:hypothetical protein